MSHDVRDSDELPDTARNLELARAWCGKQNAAILAERGGAPVGQGA